VRIHPLVFAIAVPACGLDQPAGGEPTDDLDPATTFDADAQAAPFLDGFFPIAADYQPHTAFDKWKHRGVNTVIRVPGEDDMREWNKRARELDLKMIREPAPHAGDDKDLKNVIAWHWKDEPELHGIPASQLADFRKKMHDIDPDRPIIVNFWGGGMRQANSAGCFNGHCYPDYVEHADWLSDDIYACNKFNCNIEVVGQEVSQLRHWGEHQPAFAYIETGDFDGNGTGPSPRRFKAQIWDAIIHGARGIFYFSAKIKQNCTAHCLASYDMTPPDIADEMQRTSDLIERLAPVLQRRIDPKSARMHSSDSGLEIGWRYSPDDHAYFFLVLNPGDNRKEDRRLEIEGFKPASAAKVIDESREEDIHMDSKVIVDTFDPYELHIYKVEVQP
jgi:hypothetical protein